MLSHLTDELVDYKVFYHEEDKVYVCSINIDLLNIVEQYDVDLDKLMDNVRDIIGHLYD